MRQVDWAAAQYLLSPYSSLFFGVKLLYDYGFCSSKAVFRQQTLKGAQVWDFDVLDFYDFFIMKSL